MTRQLLSVICTKTHKHSLTHKYTNTRTESGEDKRQPERKGFEKISREKIEKKKRKSHWMKKKTIPSKSVRESESRNENISSRKSRTYHPLFWAAVPKGPMTYAFTHRGYFSFSSFFSFSVHPLRSSYPSLEAQIPALRPKS